MPDYTAARTAAIELASRGEISSPIELAGLAGISRQLARLWLIDIDLHGKREAHLRPLWRREYLKAQRSRQ